MADDPALTAHELTDPINVIEHFAAQWEGMAKLGQKLRAWQPLLDDRNALLADEEAIRARIEDLRQRETALVAEVAAREAKLTELDEAITAKNAIHAGITSAIDEMRTHFALHKFDPPWQA